MKLAIMVLALVLVAPLASSETVHPALRTKVRGWQAAASNDLGASQTPLAKAYGKMRREFDSLEGIGLSDVRRLVIRVQRLSKRHYQSETVDHWPTLAQVLAKGGDDCDGLELLTYWALKDAGEPVWRAVVGHGPSGTFHAVTLWGDPSDPYVLDPTGQMTKRVRHLSFFTSWKIVAKFN